MFFERANYFLCHLILKTNHEKCDWNRYPLCFPLTDSSSQFSIQRVEHKLGKKLNTDSSFFLSQDNGFVFFLTFEKNEHHIYVQQTIAHPLTDISESSLLFNEHTKLLYQEIKKYVEEKESLPQGLYTFLDKVVDEGDYYQNDPSKAKKELSGLGMTNIEL